MLFPTCLVCLILGLINTSLYFFFTYYAVIVPSAFHKTVEWMFQFLTYFEICTSSWNVSCGIAWLFFFYANSWISLGCSCRRESARVGFMFRYLDQILFLTSCSPFPHCGNLCFRFPFLTTECEIWPFEVAPSATVSKSLHVCAMCRLSLQRLSLIKGSNFIFVIVSQLLVYYSYYSPTTLHAYDM